jgi:hypothetical protein
MLAFAFHELSGPSAFGRFLVTEQNNQINKAQNAQYVPNGVI